jgi:type IX secretion system PorP/SprF family membrane protein
MKIRALEQKRIPLIRSLLLFCFFLLFFLPALRAQDLPYSQYSFTPLKINPALVSAAHTTEFNLLYRQRHIGPDGGFHATQFTLLQPLVTEGRKWGGLGLQVSDDQAGVSPFFRQQNITAAFAYSLPLSPRQSLSFGVSGAFETKRTPQPGVRAGESFRKAPGPNVKLNSGLYYRGTDRRGHETHYIGLALIQSNHPDDNLTFYNKVPSTFLLSAGFNAWQSQLLTLTPQLLWNNRAGYNFVQLGGKVNYSFAALSSPLLSREGSLDLGLGYVSDDVLVMALTLHQPLFALGFSYDLDLNPRDAGRPFRRGPEAGLRIYPQTALQRLKKIPGDRKEKTRHLQPAPLAAPPAQQPTFSQAPPPPAALPVAKEPQAPPVVNQQTVREPEQPPAIPPLFQNKRLYFEPNHNAVEDAAQKDFLQDLAAFLMQHPGITLRIVGHTDDTGTAEDNIELSFRRAQVIAELLMEAGIQGERLVVEGQGSFNPLVPNSSPENRALNRRVEIVLEDPETDD